MKTDKSKKESTMFKTAYRFMASAVLAAILVMGCSKGDAGPAPFVEVNPVPSNTNNPGGVNEGIGVTVAIKSMEPASPATLKYGDSITIIYDYDVTRSGGARIWVEPFTDGDLSPNNFYTPSPKLEGMGTRTVHISISEGETTVVDQLKIQINKAGFLIGGIPFGVDPLSDSFELVDYTFTN